MTKSTTFPFNLTKSQSEREGIRTLLNTEYLALNDPAFKDRHGNDFADIEQKRYHCELSSKINELNAQVLAELQELEEFDE